LLHLLTAAIGTKRQFVRRTNSVAFGAKRTYQERRERSDATPLTYERRGPGSDGALATDRYAAGLKAA